jgi:protein-tyrosine-phosphatase
MEAHHTTITRALVTLAIAGSFAGGSIAAQQQNTVVFVCEHGAARSVIAAAYFNKLASERQLPYRAIARGTAPQENLSVAAVSGLESDGLAFERAAPKLLTDADVKGSVRVVGFCPIPSAFSRSVRVDEHDDVPDVGADYRAARDKILAYVMQLIEELEKR